MKSIATHREFEEPELLLGQPPPPLLQAAAVGGGEVLLEEVADGGGGGLGHFEVDVAQLVVQHVIGRRHCRREALRARVQEAARPVRRRVR